MEWDDYLNETAKLRAKYGELDNVQKKFKDEQKQLQDLIKQKEEAYKKYLASKNVPEKKGDVKNETHE